MLDSQPSRDMDDLFDFGLTPSAAAPAEQHGSRRAAREAAGSRRAAPAPKRKAVSKREAKAMVRSAHDRQELSRPSSDRKAIARAMRDTDSEPAARRLKRAESAGMRASAPKQHRKNPLSVLVTMAAVGGMFAVVGLPAYALTTTTPTSDQTAAVPTAAGTQSIIVSSEIAALAPVRDAYRATTPQQLAEMTMDALRAQNNADYLASGARELGDDYPWAYELGMSQGGGLSSLNYYYRECVDFVAWRLNRDAGSYAEPFRWVWSNLTPAGGNASQWKSAWQSHGWTVSDVPVVGSVAWFSYNHVAYVKEVLDGGKVLVEEYNYVHEQYGQRTLPISEVDAFLYAPPA